MIKPAINSAINTQINKELYSAYLYLAMSATAADNGLSGTAAWLETQAQEEMTHVMKFKTFIQQKGGRLVYEAIDAPEFEFTTLAELFAKVLEHEQYVTGLINNLMDIAIDERDHATQIFLHWFVSEQVEEEAGVQEIIDQIKLAGSQAGNLMLIDQKLGARAPIFTMPVGA